MAVLRNKKGFTRKRDWVQDNYKVKATLENNSILNSGAYTSYASVRMSEGKEYDLAILIMQYCPVIIH